MNAFLMKNQTLREEKIASRNYVIGRFAKVFLVLMLFVTGFLYVVQTSSASTRGYTLSDLKNQVENLKIENEKLQVQIASYRSMQSIQERLKNMDLVAVSDIKYINLSGSAVAMR